MSAAKPYAAGRTQAGMGRAAGCGAGVMFTNGTCARLPRQRAMPMTIDATNTVKRILLSIRGNDQPARFFRTSLPELGRASEHDLLVFSVPCTRLCSLGGGAPNPEMSGWPLHGIAEDYVSALLVPHRFGARIVSNPCERHANVGSLKHADAVDEGSMNTTATNEKVLRRVEEQPACRDYERVAAAIAYLDTHRREQPKLAEVAAHVGLSAHHFQRTFKRWSGVTPKQLLGYLTVHDAKSMLTHGRLSLLDVSAELGLSGPARLHDAFISIEAMTPGEYKDGGAGLTIKRAVHPSPFGPLRVYATARGICGLEFVPGDARSVEATWPGATYVDAPDTGEELVGMLSAGVLRGDVQLHLKGTNFQVRVWRALLGLPSGAAAGYGALAAALGHPGAARAVGSAVGRNPIAWLIPCHRVVREVGAIGEYRYGQARKRALLAWEQVRYNENAA